MERVIPSVAALEDFAREYARTLAAASSGATLLALSGELGAGKTAFTKALAKAFGVSGVVNSPTFVLEKVYQLPGGPFARLVHIDAYRLERGAELAPLDFARLMEDPKNLIVLEWPEKVADALPGARRNFTFSVAEDGVRTISYDA